MSKTKAPGDIPGWANTFHQLTEADKMRIAGLVGRSVRTVYNWASGTNKPSRQSALSIEKAFKRMGGGA